MIENKTAGQSRKMTSALRPEEEPAIQQYSEQGAAGDQATKQNICYIRGDKRSCSPPPKGFIAIWLEVSNFFQVP